MRKKEGMGTAFRVNTLRNNTIHLYMLMYVGETNFIVSRGRHRDRKSWVTDLFLVTPFRESPSMSPIAST